MSWLDLFGLSETQRAAVEDRSSHVLVSAGAGSGKTTLLVAYFVHALIDDGVPAEDMVAVTFTRKAAAELSTRIRSQLVNCGREDLARAVELSSIGTIHSLCRRLIKGRALEAGVDPAFSVLESDAADMLKLEVLDRVWAEVVESADESHLGILALHTSLRNEIIPLYDRLRNLGNLRPNVVVPAPPPLDPTRERTMQAIMHALAAAAEVRKPGKSLQSDIVRLENAFHHLQTRSPAMGSGGCCADPAAIEEELRISKTFFPGGRTTSMKEVFAPVCQALREYRRHLVGLLAQPLIAVVNDLLARFDEAYTRIKREECVLDFADLELRARALLEAHREEHAPFFGPRAHVLIDEFQDTNELQCAILENLGAERLLLVGDENQSIYRFRGADVEVFRRREAAHERVSTLAGERRAALNTGSGLHHLVDNYRSSDQILAFVNQLFGADLFFGSRFFGLKCARGQRKIPARPPRSVDVLVVNRAEPADSGDAKRGIGAVDSLVVGLEVRRLLDEEGWQPRDIAVLLSALTHAEAIREGLEALGIPSYLVRGKGYYSREEISDIRALIRALLNPHDDFAMATVLRSPLVGLSDDGLYLVGRERKARAQTRSLWRVIEDDGVSELDASDVQALESLKRGLRSFQGRVGRPGMASLVDDLITTFGYDVYALASHEGERRFANIRKLLRMADDYEALHGPDLAGFVSLLDGLEDVSSSEGSAPTLAEGENVVRIMTVHQAKGLEFPVVVLAGLESQGKKDGIPAIALSQDGTAAVFVREAETRYEEFGPFWGPGDEIVAEWRAKNEEERLRLLYVAMTRAEDRLILVGVTSQSGGLGSGPLDRVLQALGLDELPQPGECHALEGLDAVVRSVGVSELAAEFEGAQQAVASTGISAQVNLDEGLPPSPPFLETPRSAVLPRRLSFSALAAFQACPRRFYLERSLGLRLRDSGELRAGLVGVQDDGTEDDGGVRGGVVHLDQEEVSTGRDVGLLVHGLLERLALREKSPAQDELRAAAEEVMDARGLTLGQEAIERALDLTQAFWRTPIPVRAALAGAGREVPFLFAQDGTVISGVMDLVWQEGDAWFIVDYKTNALKGRSPADVAAGYDLQASVYALAALRAGAARASMEFVFLEEPETPVELLFSERDRPELQARLAGTLARIRQSDFSPSQGGSCSWCPLENLCNVLC
jgi:ATP-dependent helicase/nuclease subunit A